MAIAALLSVFIVPLAVGALWLRYGRRRPTWLRVGLGLSGCLGSLMYVAIALVFAVCWGGEFGESGKARLVSVRPETLLVMLAG
jgi:hypothetical protein